MDRKNDDRLVRQKSQRGWRQFFGLGVYLLKSNYRIENKV